MTNQINIKLDSNLLDDVNVILKSMGLSITDAVRMFLTRVKNDRAIPFDVKACGEIPNEETIRAMTEDEVFRANTMDDIWDN